LGALGCLLVIVGLGVLGAAEGRTAT
jgi:hypothetical protein